MKNLKQACIEIIESELDIESGYDFEAFKRDLNEGGCSSGLVSALLRYCDTLAFYTNHKDEIQNFINEHGFELEEMKSFDKSDKLCLERNNQNLLSWLAFEITVECLTEV